jgi:hypothetical protein
MVKKTDLAENTISSDCVVDGQTFCRTSVFYAWTTNMPPRPRSRQTPKQATLSRSIAVRNMHSLPQCHLVALGTWCSLCHTNILAPSQIEYTTQSLALSCRISAHSKTHNIVFVLITDYASYKEICGVLSYDGSHYVNAHRLRNSVSKKITNSLSSGTLFGTGLW